MSGRPAQVWLFGSARADAFAFVAPALLSLTVFAACRAQGVAPGVGVAAYLVFVVGLDVTHVWATLFRTYLDAAELRAHPLRYAGIPLAALGAGVALHTLGPLPFWRAVAYLAVLHFVRQQVGWAALYRRAGGEGRVDRIVDEAALYLATLHPLLHWHARGGEIPFDWLYPGDFVRPIALASALAPIAAAGEVLALAVFAGRQLARLADGRGLAVGRTLVVGSTALGWHLGIVRAAGDLEFTVANTAAHAVPYLLLLHRHAAARREAGARTLAAELVGLGPAAFLGLLVGLALVEEALWDRLVWHEHPRPFGAAPLLGPADVAWATPLLAVPQVAHYLLDAVLWRRREARTDGA